ncbi:MAG: hypothetical protein SPF89_02630 [Sphaerochaetaceae bacterium]|nr:hypothetical protein [Spirochaetales bacterium]MDY5498979.1 hypothetical protein [Sphaerochaetaceae bacterium]
MNKSLALISLLLLTAGSLSAAEVFNNDVKLVARVDEENRAGFYADASGENARTDWYFTSDSAQSTAYFIITSNTSHAMDLEAQLPALVWEEDEKVTMPYQTTIRLVANGNNQYSLAGNPVVLQNSNNYQVFGQMNPGQRAVGVYAFDFSIDPNVFSTAFEGSYHATVNVQITNPQ